MHVVFIAIPGWGLAAILYTAFAAVAGARGETLGELHPSESVSAPIPVAAASPAHDRAVKSAHSALRMVSGVIGALSLAACFALALWVGLGGEQEYQQNLATFKTYLAVASVVHLASAAIWVLRSEQREGN